MPEGNKIIDLQKWQSYIESIDYNPLFVSVSGAHLYGFPSHDSDIDLRGCHLLPLREVVGLADPKETFDKTEIYQGIEVDIVSHDAGKYLRMLVKNNSYILEQIFSPIVVCGNDFLKELRPIAARCITRHHYHPYRGFYGRQRELIEQQGAKTAKAVLYAYRVLLTGIHLMRSGRIEANLLNLNEHFKLTFIDELIAMKTAEKVAPAELDWDFHAEQLSSLESTLDRAFAESQLPQDRDWESVNHLLVKLRLSSS